MKGTLPDSVRVEHIRECIEEIEKAIEGHTFQSFAENHVLRIAVVKWLEIIGEASNHITEETRNMNDRIEWRKMIALRNFVVHEYFGMNYEIIWESASIFVPILKKEIESIKLD